MRIKFELESLHRSRMGGVTAEIYLYTRENYFPEEKWSDFPLIILGWWGSELCQQIDDKSKNVVCNFMDGPFGFNSKIIEEDTLLIECWEETKDKKVIELSDTRNWHDFLQNFVHVAKITVKAVKSRNWHFDESKSPTNDDLLRLESCLKKIQIFLDRKLP